MLVDNAIVVMENIFRNMDENHLPPTEAAVRGTSESPEQYRFNADHNRRVPSDRIPSRCCRRIIQGTSMDSEFLSFIVTFRFHTVHSDVGVEVHAEKR